MAVGRLDHGSDDLLEVSLRDLREPIAEGDHLALLRETDPAVVNRGGHRDDRPPGAPSAAPHGSSPSMEEPEVDPVPASRLSQGALGPMEGPVRGPVSPVLVRIRVAQHDFLETVASVEVLAVRRVGVERLHAIRRRREVVDGLEQGNEVEGACHAGLGPPKQPSRLSERHRFEDVAHIARHADDPASECVRFATHRVADDVERPEKIRHGLLHGVGGEPRFHLRSQEGFGSAEDSREHLSPGRLAQRLVVLLHSARSKHHGDGPLVNRAVLAHVEGREVEPERPDEDHESGQLPATRDRFETHLGESLGHHLQVGEERAAVVSFVGVVLQNSSKSRVHQRDLAAKGLV